MTHNSTVHCRYEGKQSSSVGSQCIDDVAFLVLTERTPVHVTNSRNVVRTLFSNFD
ncbi:MAG TPA: hypothetical protein VGJ66_13065 [Pyrinomonadaceae bacterium]